MSGYQEGFRVKIFPRAKSYKDYVKEAMTKEPKTYKNATRCPKY